MNERIRELALQATEYMQHGFTTQATYFDKEKFAQLIVRECISELEISKKADPYTGVLFECEYNKCIDEQATLLKEHFGVEP